jgi:ABC-type branched-subunit amino acid transport system ATPase component/sugar phosphate permease
MTKATNNGRRRRRAGVAVAESPIEDIETTAQRVREQAMAALGVTGEDDAPPLRSTIKDAGVRWYPLLALGLLVVVDEFQQVVLVVLGPEIAAALGLSKSAFAFAIALKTLAITLAVLPMAAYVQKVPRRAAVSIAMAFGWSVLTMATGFVVSFWGLYLLLVADGASTGSVRAVHQPLLVDSYPTSIRVRVLSAYRAFNSAGEIVAPLSVAVITGILGFTWRGVFLIAGVMCLVTAVFASRLRDPGFGAWDLNRVREEVDKASAVDVPADDAGDDVRLGFFEIVNRLMLIPTFRRLLAALAVLGMMIIPLISYLSFFLQERWELSPAERSLFFATTPVFSILALGTLSRRLEGMFRQDPAKIVSISGSLLGAGVATIALAVFAPVFAVVYVLLALGLAAVTVTTPALTMALFSIVPAHMRAHAAALQGIFLAGIGGLGGLMLLGGIDRRFGIGGAIAALTIPALLGGLILRSASRLIVPDMRRMVDDIIEHEEIRRQQRAGITPPLLACRNVSFSYGQLQVLFDVNFTVAEEEMVALLGTNGAGKSTLLRVISGLGLPSTGSVRLAGTDITFVDPDRRVRLGIAQVPGGRAVFGNMTVEENLRALAYTLGGDRKRIEEGLQATYDAFPKLLERSGQLAATLSGGEQQMLGLATAFIVRPRLLLIDELSLGLAPVVVGELLDMVRAINARGTAIVLVEQSVNIALSVVDHAYFMEKGEIRFDGPARSLLDRADLLRSVFLEGASRGLARGRTRP